MMIFPRQAYSRCSTIICMFKLMCVTNRQLCRNDFLKQIEKVAQGSLTGNQGLAVNQQQVGLFIQQQSGSMKQRIPADIPYNLSGIILREKDLSEGEYKKLAQNVMKICENYQIPCILHSFVDVALELNAKAIHLPMPILRQWSEENQFFPWKKQSFTTIGASCHSIEEAKEAQRLGCTYITVGHIFATDCKKGVPPRGLDFLEKVCREITIPVYAIGGINSENMDFVRQAGADGACIMSGFMC